LVAINGNNAMINFYPPTLCINLSIAFSAALQAFTTSPSGILRATLSVRNTDMCTVHFFVFER
jgi:hypothetical protein